jgi:hypothetical protein
MSRRSLVAALILAATPALAFDGRYGDCGVSAGDNVPVVIAGTEIRFYESACQMTNPVLVRDMPGAVLFDFVCEGEGETWTDRAFVQWAYDGGLILVWRGFAQMLPRCP